MTPKFAWLLFPIFTDFSNLITFQKAKVKRVFILVHSIFTYERDATIELGEKVPPPGVRKQK
jgi:hypothetical protein